MASKGAQLKGMSNLMRDLNKMNEKIKTSLAQQATVVMAKEIRDQAKANCYIAPAPYKVRMTTGTVIVQPGHVRDHIIVKRMGPMETSQKGYTSSHIVTIHNVNGAKNIASFVEYGTALWPKNPFMRPAYEQAKGRALTKAKAVLKKGIEGK